MPPKLPNIILTIADDQRGTAMGCAGQEPVETPAMDSLATTTSSSRCRLRTSVTRPTRTPRNGTTACTSCSLPSACRCPTSVHARWRGARVRRDQRRRAVLEAPPIPAGSESIASNTCTDARALRAGTAADSAALDHRPAQSCRRHEHSTRLGRRSITKRCWARSPIRRPRCRTTTPRRRAG